MDLSFADLEQQNRHHERCLHIICNDKQVIFQERLDEEKFLSIHSHNLQTMTIKIFKRIIGLVPDKFSIIFKTRNEMNYILRHFSNLIMPSVHSVYNVTETMSSLGPTNIGYYIF